MIVLPKTWLKVSFGVLTGDTTKPVEWLTSYRLCFELPAHRNYYQGDTISWILLHPKDHVIEAHYDAEMDEAEWEETVKSVQFKETRG